MRTITTFTLLLTLGACAEDLGDAPTPDGGPDVTLDMAVAPPSDHVQHTDLGEGVTETLVDGTDTESWIALDLDAAGAELDVDIATDTEWDLAIQRFHVRTNGGAGGPADVRVAVLDGVTLAEVTEAPSEGWRQDAEPVESEIPDSVLMNTPPFTVISNDEDPWYQYDPTTHELTPKERVYVLESTEGAYFALQVVDYYSPETAEAGWPAFQWKAVDPPSESEPGQAVDASSRDEWIYLRLDGTEVSVTDPQSSSDWDLALQRTAIRTNSGPSGPGVGGALLSERAWDAIEHTDSVGFARDELVPLPGPPGSGEAPGNPVLGDWFDYDGATHTVSARPNDSYIVRGANGDYAKLRIFGWDGGVYRLELAPVTLAPETQTTTVDASASDAWVYLSLDLGAAVTPADPATEPSWDLALQRTNLATNSGTSGEGGGGAANADVATLAEVTAVPETFAVDELVPLPGPPGSGEVSANPVLSDWYDYDFTTHAVSPKATVFVVRTARGDLVKVAITSYEDGVFELQWIHAGAGQSAFGGE